MDAAVAHCPAIHCPAAQWYVVQTKPRQEARAEAHLVRQGFECYLPVAEYAAGASVARLMPPPLFPGYLFIRMAHEARAIFLCNDGDKHAVILLALLAHQQRVALPRQPLKQVVTHAY